MTDYSSFTTPADRAWQETYRKNNLDIQLVMPDGVNNLLDFFDVNFRANRGQKAITFMGVHIGYDELDKISLKIAAYLQSLGLAQGDKVAVMMPNSPQYLAVMMGIVRAGLVLVNVNPLYTAHELEHQLKDSEAKVLFIVENFAHTFEKVQDKGQISHVITTGIGDMMGIKGIVINAVVRHLKKKWCQIIASQIRLTLKIY